SDTLVINTGSSGTGISFGHSSFQSCTALLTDATGVLTCGTDDDDTSLRTDVTNGYFNNTEATIVGADAAVTNNNIGAGDLRIADEFEAIGNGFIGANLVVGASTSSTETLSNGAFTLGGDDLFVAGDAGIEGTLYIDTSLQVDSTSATAFLLGDGTND